MIACGATWPRLESARDVAFVSVAQQPQTVAQRPSLGFNAVQPDASSAAIEAAKIATRAISGRQK